MTTEPTTTTTRTRRAVLGAALGGAAAVAAQSIAPLTARAIVLPQVDLGGANTATTVTSIENTTDAQTSFAGVHSATGTAVSGTSATGTGVLGTSTAGLASGLAGTRQTGVFGTSGDASAITWSTDETGVYGYCETSGESTGVWGDSVNGFGVYGYGWWGIFGEASQPGAIGVMGLATPTSTGVFGWAGDTVVGPPAPATGVGVYAGAQTTTQTALQVNGKVKFSRSGRKAIGKTATWLKVPMAGVTTASYVVATLQTSVSAVYVRCVVPASGSFTIYLSKAPGKLVYVGYMVIN